MKQGLLLVCLVLYSIGQNIPEWDIGEKRINFFLNEVYDMLTFTTLTGKYLRIRTGIWYSRIG